MFTVHITGIGAFECGGATFAHLQQIRGTGQEPLLAVNIAGGKVVDVFRIDGPRWLEMQEEMEFDRQYLCEFQAARR